LNDPAGTATRAPTEPQALLDHVAALARIPLGPEERERLGRQFGEIVRFVDQLREWEETAGRSAGPNGELAGAQSGGPVLRLAPDVPREWEGAADVVKASAGSNPTGVLVPVVVDPDAEEP
jgi:Asp-tRNA(Asn)/Glu-tRNA(Gln) amidotransferase C subunit